MKNDRRINNMKPIDYKKKYEEALKTAKLLRDNSEDAVCNNKIEAIFPELQESEDEKIQKELLEYLKLKLKCSPLTDRQTELITKAIAWLEKQESEPNWCHHKVDLSNCSEEYRKAYYDGWNNCNMQHSQCKSKKQGEQPNKVSIWKHWKDGIAGNGDNVPTYLIKNGSTYSISSCLGFECDYIELSELDSLMLENRCEQTSTNKIEPKFKVDDCIRHKGSDECYRIVTIDDNYYFCQNNHAWAIKSQDYFELVDQKSTNFRLA